MRSRYTAYARQDAAYLLRTWHVSTRPLTLPMSPLDRWVGLKILQTAMTGTDTATVQFTAVSERGGKRHRMTELSRFVREGGLWFYVDGDVS